MYLLTDNKFYVGNDFRGRPATVTAKEYAITFKTKLAADNFLRCIPDSIKNYRWQVSSFDEATLLPEIKTFGNTTKTTTMEEEDFNICEFFTNVIEVMSQIDRYIANMTSNEQITDMKILDVRHYIRDNNHNLNAIQMQRLGYYLQTLERERYEYKSNRLIASMFVNSIEALKDKNNISKLTDVVTSKYRPKILDDTDIEYIINKKKDAEYIA